MGTEIKTIAINFDGVIHKYSQGYKSGNIYDVPIIDSIQSLKELLSKYYVCVVTSRELKQVKQWLDSFGFTCDILPIEQQIYSNIGRLGLSNRKIVSDIFIDYKAIKFEGDWKKILNEISIFKTWLDE